jgi:hypothetical protein
VKNPKAKGGAFEREVCKVLSLWVSHGERTDLFWRSAMSGGRATVHGRSVRQCGDVCSVAPEGHVLTDRYYIECKHLKALQLFGLIDGNGLLLKHWQKTVREATKYKLTPMLIARQNNRSVLLCCSEHVQMHPPLLTANMYDMHIYRFNDLLKRRFRNGGIPRRRITFQRSAQFRQELLCATWAPKTC